MHRGEGEALVVTASLGAGGAGVQESALEVCPKPMHRLQAYCVSPGLRVFARAISSIGPQLHAPYDFSLNFQISVYSELET